MQIPITTDAPLDTGGTSVLQDLDGNLLVKRADLPAMTIRPGTVAPQTWAMLSAQAKPLAGNPTGAPVAPLEGGGVLPTTPSMPPGVALPPPRQETFAPPTSDAGPQNVTAPMGGGVAPSAAAGGPNFSALIGNNPRLMAMQERAFADAKKANAEGAELEGLRATEEAALQRKANAEIERREQAAQTQRDYLANRLELEERKRNEAVQVAAAMKLNPNRLMSTKSDSEKVGMVLASILGGFGAGINGGPNEALAAIDRAIDLDIDAQKNNILGARENVSMHNNLVAQMRQKGLDFDSSVLAAKQVKLEQMKRQMDVLASEYKGPESEVRAKAFNAAMDQKLAELKIHQDNTMKARMTQLLDKMPAPGGKALNEGTAKELGEANGAVKTVQDLLKQFNGNADGVGGWIMSYLPTTDASRYEARARVAAQTIGTYLEGGKMTDADVPRYMKMLPQPGDGKELARTKADAISKAVGARQASQKAALAGSGYRTAGIKDAAPVINFKPTGG